MYLEIVLIFSLDCFPCLLQIKRQLLILLGELIFLHLHQVSEMSELFSHKWVKENILVKII